MKSERTLRRELRAHRIALSRLNISDFDDSEKYHARRTKLLGNIDCLIWALDSGRIKKYRVSRPLVSIFRFDRLHIQAKAGLLGSNRRQDTRRA